MTKRSKLALVILIGILLLGLGLYIFFSPFLDQRKLQQPPALPSSAQPTFNAPTGGQAQPTPSAPAPTPEQVTADQNQRILENRARSSVERIGSGTSENGFLGYTDAMGDLSTSGQLALKAEQSSLQKAYPPTGAFYGISTRAVSSKTISGSFGDATLVVSVEAIQSITTGSPSAKPTSKAKRADVTFSKQSSGSYLIDSITWSDISL